MENFVERIVDLKPEATAEYSGIVRSRFEAERQKQRGVQILQESKDGIAMTGTHMAAASTINLQVILFSM